MNGAKKNSKSTWTYPVSTTHLYLLLSSWRNNHNGAARHPNSANVLLLLIGPALNYYMVRVTLPQVTLGSRRVTIVEKEESESGRCGIRTRYVRWGRRMNPVA